MNERNYAHFWDQFSHFINNKKTHLVQLASVFLLFFSASACMSAICCLFVELFRAITYLCCFIFCVCFVYMKTLFTQPLIYLRGLSVRQAYHLNQEPNSYLKNNSSNVLFPPFLILNQVRHSSTAWFAFFMWEISRRDWYFSKSFQWSYEGM